MSFCPPDSKRPLKRQRMSVTVTASYTRSPDHRIFIVDFLGTSITTTVTSTNSVVRKWIRSTLHFSHRYLSRLVVGVGVQWPPYSNAEAATLQLCVGRRCLIFQLIRSDTVPRLLRRFLLDPNYTFVGIWNHSDANKLRESKHRLQMIKPLDLRCHALSMNGKNLLHASFETIASEFGFEGVRLEQWISKSEWDDYSLSDEQVLQACVDAHVSFEIGKRLRAWEIENDI